MDMGVRTWVNDLSQNKVGMLASYGHLSVYMSCAGKVSSMFRVFYACIMCVGIVFRLRSLCLCGSTEDLLSPTTIISRVGGVGGCVLSKMQTDCAIGNFFTYEQAL